MGAGEPQAVLPVFRRVMIIAYTAILPLVVLIALFPTLALRIYTDNPELIAASVPALMVMLSSHLLNVPAFVLFNTVSGTGNTRTALLLETLALIIYALYVYYIVIYLQADVAVCWTTEHVYAAALLLLSLWYMRKGKWADKKI